MEAALSSWWVACSIYQEIWKSGKLYEYPTNNLDNVQSVVGPLKDGWGVTTDQASLIMSDGSSTLSWVDPASQTVTKTIKVGFVETTFSLTCMSPSLRAPRACPSADLKARRM